jgi:hypothetical protein
MITHEDRQAVLAAASAIVTDPSSAIDVVVAAIPILTWLQAAPDEDDLKVRREVLERHHANCYFVAAKRGMTAEEFLSGCSCLYGFAAEPATAEAA